MRMIALMLALAALTSLARAEEPQHNWDFNTPNRHPMKSDEAWSPPTMRFAPCFIPGKEESCKAQPSAKTPSDRWFAGESKIG